MTGILTKREDWETDSHTESTHVARSSRVNFYKSVQPQGAGGPVWDRFSPGPQRNPPCLHLGIGPLASRTVGAAKACFCSATQFGVFCYGSPRRLIHGFSQVAVRSGRG